MSAGYRYLTFGDERELGGFAAEASALDGTQHDLVDRRRVFARPWTSLVSVRTWGNEREQSQNWWCCYPDELMFEIEGTPPSPSHP